MFMDQREEALDQGTSEDFEMLFVKMSEVDPDAMKIVQEYHASILKCFTQMEGDKPTKE